MRSRSREPPRLAWSAPCGGTRSWRSLDPASAARRRLRATALGIGESTVRRYLDLLEHLFLIRQLRPWHENLRKRQVKRPKLYFRDSGLFHQLIGANAMSGLLTNPRLGASWEGFILEKTLAEARPDQAFFWGTHAGAELDLLLFANGRRVGVDPLR